MRSGGGTYRCVTKGLLNIPLLELCDRHFEITPLFTVFFFKYDISTVVSQKVFLSTVVTHRTYGSSNSNWYVKFQMFMSARAFWRVNYFCCCFLFYYTLANGFKVTVHFQSILYVKKIFFWSSVLC